jgi:apolipoprotein D and lipocalin family protein
MQKNSEVTMRILKLISGALLLTILTGCKTVETLPAVDYVDLERFMGDWHVIANIPTFIETQAYNPTESYRLNQDGTVATTFAFNKGGFDEEKKEYHPTGFITEGSGNAVWGMQFLWPFKADYRIVYLDDDYEKTIIGRNRRDYVWIMARSPEITKAEYDELVARVRAMGYSTELLKKVTARL